MSAITDEQENRSTGSVIDYKTKMLLQELTGWKKDKDKKIAELKKMLRKGNEKSGTGIKMNL